MPCCSFCIFSLDAVLTVDDEDVLLSVVTLCVLACVLCECAELVQAARSVEDTVTRVLQSCSVNMRTPSQTQALHNYCSPTTCDM